MNETCPLDQKDQRCERMPGHDGSHRYPDRLKPLTIAEQWEFRSKLEAWRSGEGPHPAWAEWEGPDSPDGTRWKKLANSPANNSVSTTVDANKTDESANKRREYMRELMRKKREAERDGSD